MIKNKEIVKSKKKFISGYYIDLEQIERNGLFYEYKENS